jgi:hypothetical protein
MYTYLGMYAQTMHKHWVGVFECIRILIRMLITIRKLILVRIVMLSRILILIT